MFFQDFLFELVVKHSGPIPLQTLWMAKGIVCASPRLTICMHCTPLWYDSTSKCRPLATPSAGNDTGAGIYGI